MQSTIKRVFSTSSIADIADANNRNIGYVLRKSSEELGELSVEVQIALGETYKEPGKDGITGEAIDLLITALDMIYLDNHKTMSIPDMAAMVDRRVEEKLLKWINSTSKK